MEFVGAIGTIEWGFAKKFFFLNFKYLKKTVSTEIFFNKKKPKKFEILVNVFHMHDVPAGSLEAWKPGSLEALRGSPDR